ncbi:MULTISPECIES: hypothetical protein [Actinosynnema]|uniref:hypothetical protein n=1 Tax=Actinosynnema TaxID=40566 RepID=UPI0020A5A089|nr:hypothetical protein [Actinosynnema pretiosum]MCP2093913.1 hypothetical protein [Actinosynnema pretiosum]
MQPLVRRLLPVLAVYFGAPAAAEYPQAYLTTTGDVVVQLQALLILGPLYGGAALLIREVAVRARMGWTGVLLLAGSFGLAMTGLIDLSMFTAEYPEVEYWAELREPTLIGALGISAYTTIAWVTGHVAVSVGVPLALLHSLAPEHRGRPLLGKVGIPVVAVLGVGVALLIRGDSAGTPSAVQTWWVAVVCAVVAGVAFTRVGRAVAVVEPGVGVEPVAGAEPGVGAGVGVGVRTLPAWKIVVVVVVTKLAFDLMLPDWVFTTISAVIVVGAVVALRRLARRGLVGAREIGLIGGAVLVAGTLLGFVTPLPPGVEMAAKIGQSAVLLSVAVAITVWVAVEHRRQRRVLVG